MLEDGVHDEQVDDRGKATPNFSRQAGGGNIEILEHLMRKQFVNDLFTGYLQYSQIWHQDMLEEWIREGKLRISSTHRPQWGCLST